MRYLWLLFLLTSCGGSTESNQQPLSTDQLAQPLVQQENQPSPKISVILDVNIFKRNITGEFREAEINKISIDSVDSEVDLTGIGNPNGIQQSSTYAKTISVSAADCEIKTKELCFHYPEFPEYTDTLYRSKDCVDIPFKCDDVYSCDIDVEIFHGVPFYTSTGHWRDTRFAQTLSCI